MNKRTNIRSSTRDMSPQYGTTTAGTRLPGSALDKLLKLGLQKKGEACEYTVSSPDLMVMCISLQYNAQVN